MEEISLRHQHGWKKQEDFFMNLELNQMKGM